MTEIIYDGKRYHTKEMITFKCKSCYSEFRTNEWWYEIHGTVSEKEDYVTYCPICEHIVINRKK